MNRLTNILLFAIFVHDLSSCTKNDLDNQERLPDVHAGCVRAVLDLAVTNNDMVGGNKLYAMLRATTQPVTIVVLAGLTRDLNTKQGKAQDFNEKKTTYSQVGAMLQMEVINANGIPIGGTSYFPMSTEKLRASLNFIQKFFSACFEFIFGLFFSFYSLHIPP